ncbi:uncharacterized protein [Rutidosis leptorrhynchoides]|uniref:uncharacterized protein n=1 Tax=Rutidosis leptorrhynchoides TaxID=125765 RepID=UPI003A99E19C
MESGSSKSSGIGEVSIDFANFADATKISSLTLPLKNANCAAFLHVSIQRVQESLDQREIDVSENANRQDRSLRAQLSNGDTEENTINYPIEEQGTLTDNRGRQGSIGSDITLSGSDISSGVEPEPKETKTTHEPCVTTIHEERHVSQWDWLDGSPPEVSTDDSSISPGDHVLGEIIEDGSPESVIKKLKAEIEVLSRQADVAGLELQTLRKQIVKEKKKGQDLSQKIDELNEERNAFKDECEKLKANKDAKVKGDPWDLVDELRQELNYETDLNSNLRIQLQKTQESNAELILAVQDLDAMLEQKDLEMSRSKSKSKSRSESCELEEVKLETDDEDEDQKALEDIVREHSGMQEAYLLEQKITELYGEIEQHKRDKNELEMQMEQISLDYEILKQSQSQNQEQMKIQYESNSYSVVNELESQIESLNNELKLKSEKLSQSVLAVEELETCVKNLENDLEDQARDFETDIEDLMNEKVKQEQRAIIAEESLRKMKLQNANTAERLQEEFKRLSMQMNSSFNANEKVMMKAMDEANKLRVEKRYLEETVKKVKQDLDDVSSYYEGKLVDLMSLVTEKSKHLEKVENQFADISGYVDEIQGLKADKLKLESEINRLENEVFLARKEVESSNNVLVELTDVNKQKDGEYERLKSEMERLISRYNDIKLSLTEDEAEKEMLRSQISLLKDEIKKNEDALSCMENKLNDNSSKEAINLKNQIEQLEGIIKLKEHTLKSSENSFLEKEKDLEYKIQELEKILQVVNETSANSQASAADEMELLKSLNKSMEVELLEMQERYSEISLKFAEVEGERQKLVMTLRNLKNRRNSSHNQML